MENKENDMDYIEANEWLKGNRSTCNSFNFIEETSHVLVAQADAAMREQAYWVARAKKEKLTF